MVARLVRDQKVVGSSPVTSTKNTGTRFLCFFLWVRYAGIEGRQASIACAGRRYRPTTKQRTTAVFRARPPKAQVPSPQPKTQEHNSCVFFLWVRYAGIEGRQASIACVGRRYRPTTKQRTSAVFRARPPKAQVPSPQPKTQEHGSCVFSLGEVCGN